MIKITMYLILSYLCGAIPFGYIVAKVFKNIDIRKQGSGNPGATNVYRTVSKPLGVLTLVLDILKGFLPVYFVTFINPTTNWIVILVALVTIVGHVFTVFLNFKGGKGVATGCGVFLALNPLATLICFAIFVVILLIFRYVSFSSIIAAMMLPITLFFLNSDPEIVLFSGVVAILVVIRHVSNIKRLLNGTENKIFGTKTTK